VIFRRDNDVERFEALVREHQRAIYRVAHRLCGNPTEAEDLIQETLIEAFESFPRFREGTNFDRWVFRIMRNTFIDSVRRRPKARLESLESGLLDKSGELMLREVVDADSAPDTEIMARTLDEPVQNALDALPPEFKIVVILADIEGLSYEEVSRIAGCPVGTVRSRLHRGRAILKDKLKGYVRL
jgi:RNA polymerase sigma-70 factor (ECF subfamily)